MRRIAILLGVLMLAWIGLVGAVAQEPTPKTTVPTPTPPPVQPLPQSIFLHPIDPATIAAPLTPLGGNEASDLCETATEFVFLNEAIGGVTPNIEVKNSSDSDPTLSCMWGNPSRPNGYRTVWYKFTAVTNAVVSINSDTSNYDTVVGVFTSDATDPAIACTTLTPVACNDDYTGFTSFTTFSIVQGQTYYIVIADWSAASSGQQTLNIFIQPQPVAEQWQLVGNDVRAQVTHHDTAVNGADIYVVGGQTNVLGTPNRTNQLSRYNVSGNSWTTLQQMPGTGLTDLSAVYVDGRIFVPGGDDGSPSTFNPTHFVYFINGNFWSFASMPPVAVGWAQTVAAANQSGYYLLGGITTKPVQIGTSTGIADTYFYDIAANQWLPKPPMTTPRFGHMAARLGNRICVVGGLNGSTLLGSGECFVEFAQPPWQPISSLNIPRYGAGSAVGPDGRWYIFGGTTYRNNVYTPVSSTEVYDPAHPEQGWSVLGVPFDLVDPNTVFARAHPAGEFVGNYLYAIGGNHFVPSLSNYQVVPLVQRLYVPSFKLYLPIMSKSGAVDFDDNMGAARPLPFNTWVFGNFPISTDFYDFYYFDLSAPSGISAQLTGIPSGSNYDLYLFGSNKLLWSSSTNPGTVPEVMNLTLSPGRYYLLVQRVYGLPEGSGYQVAVFR